MNLCTCGNTVDNNDALCPRCSALRILELGTDASEKEIRNAYHVLVKVWHPDRFQGDNALKETAETKLKDINAAYMFLTSGSSKAGPSPKRRSTASPPPERKTSPAVSPARRTSRWVPLTLKLLSRFVLVMLALLIGRYIWIAFDLQDITGEAATVFGYGKDSVLNGLDAPKRRFLAAVEQDLRRLDPRIPSPATALQTEDLANSPHAGQKSPRRQPAKVHAAPHMIYPYITAGSTRDEVLEMLGTPTASSGNMLAYGRSELYFKDGSVVGWRIDPVSSPIRVKLWPESSVDPTLDSFTIGSSKDIVLVVQGTPTAFSDDKFEYGGSVVYFQNNRVVRWKSDPATIPLRARLN